MKKTVVSFLLAAVMGLSSPAGSLCIPEEPKTIKKAVPKILRQPFFF